MVLEMNNPVWDSRTLPVTSGGTRLKSEAWVSILPLHMRVQLPIKQL